MPETINERRVFSLFEVMMSIQKTIAERYGSSFWIKAEMNKLNHYLIRQEREHGYLEGREEYQSLEVDQGYFES